jgi:hypothetical protein
MRFGIAFRVSNDKLKNYGRYSLMRDGFGNPLLMYPDMAKIMKEQLINRGVQKIKFIPEKRASIINDRHFNRLFLKYK